MDPKILEKYQPVIGLEIHAQLSTASKIFAADVNEFGEMPNTNVSVITLGHPGTLPKVNRKAVEYAVRMGLASGCEINRNSFFDRKNYFYPDLPKGYQTTQDKAPICKGGGFTIKTSAGEKYIRLNRIHLEDDAGKNLHLDGEVDTLVDYNRAGTPLIEIVTEPDLRNSEEAYALLTEVRKLVRYIDICDGNMEEGSLRCDANVSVMLKGATEFGKKVEVKNMNSIRNVQRAIDFEIERQIKAIEAGETIKSESRQFDTVNFTTHSMREKEELNDYRYFPEPDLQPMRLTEETIQRILKETPALPQHLYAQFTKEFGLSEIDANALLDVKEIALFFVEVCKHTKNYKAAANFINGPIKSYLNELTMSMNKLTLTPEGLADVIALVDSGKVSFAMVAQKILPEVIKSRGTKKSLQLAEELNLIQNSDASSLVPIVEEVLAKWPDKVKEYKGGKTGVLQMFMGEVMKATKGKADPKVTTELIKQKLEE